jgi:hypothetical protein
MPICECGFNWAKARLEGRDLESFAVIRDRDYRRVVKKEFAILSEKDKEKKGKLLFNASQWVGSLMHCPECGAWMFLPPEKRSELHEFILLKPATDQMPDSALDGV